MTQDEADAIAAAMEPAVARSSPRLRAKVRRLQQELAVLRELVARDRAFLKARRRRRIGNLICFLILVAGAFWAGHYSKSLALQQGLQRGYRAGAAAVPVRAAAESIATIAARPDMQSASGVAVGSRGEHAVIPQE